MTSRSFRPSSINIRPSRPSFACTSSNSSSCSIQSQASVQSELAVTPGSPRRAKPIAIELPPRRTIGSINTPTEPLTGRADDSKGGYFPFHEDIASSFKPHPHMEAEMPRIASRPASPISAFQGHTPFGEAKRPSHKASPILSPMAMPIGKYHPSNFKIKTNENTPLASPGPAGQIRNQSDIRAQIKQYQRDVAEQTSFAGRIPMTRPENPRLCPLGSPGPVTPMELEAAGYFGLSSEGGDVTRLIEKEKERTRERDREKEKKASPLHA